MPSTATSTVSDALIASITHTQTLATSGIDAWTDLLSKVPVRTSLDSLPFSDLLPAPKDVLDSGFGVVEALVSAQREIATKLVEATEPQPA